MKKAMRSLDRRGDRRTAASRAAAHAPRSPTRQRGAAALLLALALFGAMALTALYAHRRSLIEQRAAAQHQRSAQAFAAAEAGIDWALAQLNAGRRIGDDCLPTPDPAAPSFRTRLLTIDPSTGAVDVVPGASAACVGSAGGWSCRCAKPGAAAPPAALPDGAPAFRLDGSRSDAPGVIRLIATGCNRLAAPCAAGASTTAEASAQVEVAVALLPALPAPPAAAATLGGAFDAGVAAIGLANADPTTGWLIDAGGDVRAPFARTTVPAGSSANAAIVERDAALAGPRADRFHATFFGMAPDAWARAQPVVSVRCPADCGDTIDAEVRDAADGALIRVEGDATVRGPRRFGSPERPVLLTATGRVRFEGAVDVHGVVDAASMQWTGSGPGGIVRGALLVATDFTSDAAPTLIRDAAILDRLHRASGRFVRVNGSWHDDGPR